MNTTGTEILQQWEGLHGNDSMDDYLPKLPKAEPQDPEPGDQEEPKETTPPLSPVGSPPHPLQYCQTSQNKSFIARTTTVEGMDPSVQTRAVPSATLNSFNRTVNHSAEPAHGPTDSTLNDCDQYEEIGNRSLLQMQDQVQTPSLSLQQPEIAIKEEMLMASERNGNASQITGDHNNIPSKLSQARTVGRPGLRQGGVKPANNRKKPTRSVTNGQPKTPDAIQLLFRSYAEQFKKFNRPLQGRLSVQMAKLFAAADNEQVQYEECLGVIETENKNQTRVTRQRTKQLA